MTDEIMAQQRNLTKETEVHQEQSRALQQVVPDIPSLRTAIFHHCLCFFECLLAKIEWLVH